jgi:hypothetical protein
MPLTTRAALEGGLEKVNCAAYASLTSKNHMNRSGSRRSGSPWMTKVWPPDGDLIVGAWARDLARPQLERGGLSVGAGLAEADDRVRTPCDDAHRDRLTARRRVYSVGPERGERRVHHPGEHRHQVRLPLISTRGRYAAPS